ncbi:spore wall and anchoring disk complex protein [Tubulinosema ratisbonensis]|uniref:Spore wall and anchoring disk complex protein n=1 Tax=Tubulinosema ratisbonensis TaxID=291195 RepID=A0A437AI09_9MICR|nr:spore wall and anchoring disk complex protein [Tubulinosema ratisbonensis]
MNILNKIVFIVGFMRLSYQKAKSEKALILIKGRCGDSPESICAKNGVVGAGADTNNIDTLISILKNAGVESAYVNGWNGTPGNFVLRSNGALAPFSPFTNDTEYTFCYKECPCPPHGAPQVHRVMPSAQPVVSPAPQIVCPPVVCPPIFPPHKPVCPPFYPPSKPVCPPVRCDSQSSEEINHSVENKCRVFPSKVVCVGKTPKPLGCGDRLCYEKKRIDTTRSFDVCVESKRKFNCSFGKKNRRVKVKVTEHMDTKDVKFVELSRHIKNNSKDCKFPDFLRCPEVLAKYAAYLAKRCSTKPCFYIGGEHCNQLFVQMHCEFYRVAISPKDFCCCRIPFHKIRLCSVFGAELRHLVKKGLASVNLVIPADC